MQQLKNSNVATSRPDEHNTRRTSIPDLHSRCILQIIVALNQPFAFHLTLRLVRIQNLVQADPVFSYQEKKLFRVVKRHHSRWIERPQIEVILAPDHWQQARRECWTSRTGGLDS